MCLARTVKVTVIHTHKGGIVATTPRQTNAEYKLNIEAVIKEFPEGVITSQLDSDLRWQQAINSQAITAFLTPATPQNPLVPMTLTQEYSIVPMDRFISSSTPTLYDDSTIELTATGFVSGSPTTGDYLGSYIGNTGLGPQSFEFSGYVNVVPNSGSESILCDFMLDIDDGNGFNPLGFDLPATQTNQININIIMPKFTFTMQAGWKMALGVKCESVTKDCTLIQAFFTVSNVPNSL